VNKVINFLLNGYTPPASSGGDPLSNYVLNATGVSYEGDAVGVTYGGKAVVLHSTNSLANYPASATESSFQTAAAGTLAVGFTTVSYSAHAVLLSMRQITPYGTPTPVTVQTWRITGDASVSGSQKGQVEVSAILEQQVTPVFIYAAFATNNGCSALQFGGGGTTGSYDDATVVSGTVTIQSSGGNVGTNGNLSTNGNPTTIYGSLSTPRSGVGSCSSSNVTAWSASNGNVTGGIVELPQPVLYLTPVIPAAGTVNLSLAKNAKCPTGAGAIPGCTASGTDFHLPPGSYGDIKVTGQENLHVSAGVYNINSFQEQSAQSSLIIDSGPVIFNVTGKSVTGSVVDLTGNSVQNPTLVAANFQIMYAGTGAISLKGQSQASGLLYAPNATFSFTGGSTWYGAVIGASMSDMGGAAIYYDSKLSNSALTVGNPTQTSFTWKKF
jgi:hypothetical protein